MTNSLRFTSVRAWAAAISLAAIAAGSAAASPVTFARYFQSNDTQQQWTISANSTTTSVSAAGSVLMLFSGIAGLPFSGAFSADTRAEFPEPGVLVIQLECLVGMSKRVVRGE